MTIEKALMVLAGVMVMLTALLSVYHHPWWIWFTVFVGFNMFQSSFTGICPAAFIFKKMGLKTEAEAANES